jgi:hypothetical protein
MLPGRHFDDPEGMVMVSLSSVANGYTVSAVFPLTEADAYLFEEGSARFYPLVERSRRVATRTPGPSSSRQITVEPSGGSV